MPTYLLTPSATLSFSQHVGHKVEITGTAQTAPLPPTVQEIATAPTQRPGEQAEHQRHAAADGDDDEDGDARAVRRREGGLNIRPYILKMPNFAGGIGALNAADSPSASALARLRRIENPVVPEPRRRVIRRSFGVVLLENRLPDLRFGFRR